jgi:uncharacterized protein (DUF1501 family)
MIDRRIFLKSTGMALVGGAFLPGVFVRMAQGAVTGGRRTLVVIFQRGAVDGLNVVVPYGEPDYYRVRPSIAIPRPGAGEEAALDLDGFFGVHPALEPLVPFYRQKALAFVHASGSPDPTRSHFDAQDFMESGTPGVKSTEDGFLARAVTKMPKRGSSPLRAVSLTPTLPRILSGPAGAVAMTSVQQFGIRAGAATAAVSESFESMYGEAVDDALGGTAKESFEAMKILKSANPAAIQPANGADYPRSPLGNALEQIAQLVRSDVGLEVAFADVGGWDTHVGEGGARGQLANNLRNFAAAVAAFANDLGSRMGDVVLVTVSEFGRTVRENGNRGTDHGHGNVITLLGGGVRGGRVAGKWPGLSASALYENRDLAVTTDFRDVFAEVLQKHLGVADLASVFPRYDASPRKWRGVMA